MKRGGPLRRRTPLRRVEPQKTRAPWLDWKHFLLARGPIGVTSISERHPTDGTSVVEAVIAGPPTLMRFALETITELSAVELSVVSLLPPAFPKARKLRSPMWLRIVRTFPCFMNQEHGVPYLRAAKEGLQQSDPHHFPTKGSSAGGSDLETMPVCRRCHELITDGKLDPTGSIQEIGVVETQRTIFRMLRSGVLPLEALLVVAEEVQAS